MTVRIDEDEVTVAIKQELLASLRSVHESNLPAEDKVAGLVAKYKDNALVTGRFSAEYQLLMGFPALSFSGYVNGEKISIAVC